MVKLRINLTQQTNAIFVLNIHIFSADPRPKYSCEYSQIIAYDISVLKCIWCLDGLEVILEPGE